MSRTIGLRLAYEGTRYSGWQAQPGRTTVQGTLAAAIRDAVQPDETLFVLDAMIGQDAVATAETE